MGKHLDAAVAELRAAMKESNECDVKFGEVSQLFEEAKKARGNAGARENNARFGMIQAALDDIAEDG